MLKKTMFSSFDPNWFPSRNLFFAALCSTALFTAGCGSDAVEEVVENLEEQVESGGGESTTDSRYNDAVTGSIAVTVYSVQNSDAPIQGATVKLNSSDDGSLIETVTTDSSGIAQFSSVTAGQFYTLEINHADYIVRTVKIQSFLKEDEAMEVNAAMLSIGEAVQVTNSEATEFVLDNAVISLPALAFGEAELTVNATGVDPTNADDLEAYQGLDAIDENGERQRLFTYGVYDINFYDSEGNYLQLQNDNTAELTLPLFNDTHEDGTTVVAGDSVPLWRLNEQTGVWQYEGEGEVVAAPSQMTSPTGLAVRGDVSHFSSYNMDRTVTGRFWNVINFSNDGVDVGEGLEDRPECAAVQFYITSNINYNPNSSTPAFQGYTANVLFTDSGANVPTTHSSGTNVTFAKINPLINYDIHLLDLPMGDNPPGDVAGLNETVTIIKQDGAYSVNVYRGANDDADLNGIRDMLTIPSFTHDLSSQFPIGSSDSNLETTYTLDTTGLETPESAELSDAAAKLAIFEAVAASLDLVTYQAVVFDADNDATLIRGGDFPRDDTAFTDLIDSNITALSSPSASTRITNGSAASTLLSKAEGSLGYGAAVNSSGQPFDYANSVVCADDPAHQDFKQEFWIDRGWIRYYCWEVQLLKPGTTSFQIDNQNTIAGKPSKFCIEDWHTTDDCSGKGISGNSVNDTAHCGTLSDHIGFEVNFNMVHSDVVNEDGSTLNQYGIEAPKGSTNLNTSSGTIYYHDDSKGEATMPTYDYQEGKRLDDSTLGPR